MKFFSRCNRPVTVAVPVGGTLAPVYEERIVDGVQRLVVVGNTNLYDYVQSSKEECLIYNILDRFYRGDITALTSKVGQFIDVTGMPSTLAEAQQLLINASEKFSHLPADIQAKFDGDVNKYISKIANASIDDLKSFFGVGEPAAPVEEVKTDVA